MEQPQSQHHPFAYYRTSCWKPAVFLPLGTPAKDVCCFKDLLNTTVVSNLYNYNSMKEVLISGTSSCPCKWVPVCALAKIKYNVDEQATLLCQLNRYRLVPTPANVVGQYVMAASLPQLQRRVKLDDILLRKSGLSDSAHRCTASDAHRQPFAQ